MRIQNVLFLLQVVLFIQNICFGDSTSADDEVEQREERSHRYWSSEMRAQFAEFCKTANPNEPHRFKKLVNEWLKLHPDCNDTKNALYQRYRSITQQIRRNSSSVIGEQGKRNYNIWTSEMEAQLAEIYRKTNSNQPYHFEKVKYEWFNSHPDSNVTEKALHHRYLQISHQVEPKSMRPKYDFKWDEKKYNDLVDAYLSTYPYKKFSHIMLRDEWKHRHGDSPNFNSAYLTKRAQSWIKKRKMNFEGESSRSLFEWTHRKDSDLLHTYYVTLPEGKRHVISMHRIFANLHPDLRELTTNQMAERIQYLKRNPPDEHFPWTKEQNKELLEIYHSTSPEVADQGQRIHDIWSKIHPSHSFMTPYYLQVHASTLAHNEEMTVSGKKKYRLTDEQKANLVNMYQRMTKLKKSSYDFHKAWVREYPSMASGTPQKIIARARRLVAKDDSSHEGMKDGGEQLELHQSRHWKHHKYTPEERVELLAAYHQTYPEEYGHSKRFYEKLHKERKYAVDMKGRGLRRVVQHWIKRDADEKGKAPMVVPKVEAKSESSPSASDSSK